MALWDQELFRLISNRLVFCYSPLVVSLSNHTHEELYVVCVYMASVLRVPGNRTFGVPSNCRATAASLEVGWEITVSQDTKNIKNQYIATSLFQIAFSVRGEHFILFYLNVYSSQLSVSACVLHELSSTVWTDHGEATLASYHLPRGPLHYPQA